MAPCPQCTTRTGIEQEYGIFLIHKLYCIFANANKKATLCNFMLTFEPKPLRQCDVSCASCGAKEEKHVVLAMMARPYYGLSTSDVGEVDSVKVRGVLYLKSTGQQFRK